MNIEIKNKVKVGDEIDIENVAFVLTEIVLNNGIATITLEEKEKFLLRKSDYLNYFGMLKDISGLKINKEYTVGKKCLGCYYKGFYNGKEVCVTKEKCWRLKK